MCEMLPLVGMKYGIPQDIHIMVRSRVPKINMDEWAMMINDDNIVKAIHLLPPVKEHSMILNLRPTDLHEGVIDETNTTLKLGDLLP